MHNKFRFDCLFWRKKMPKKQQIVKERKKKKEAQRWKWIIKIEMVWIISFKKRNQSAFNFGKWFGLLSRILNGLDAWTSHKLLAASFLNEPFQFYIMRYAGKPPKSYNRMWNKKKMKRQRREKRKISLNYDVFFAFGQKIHGRLPNGFLMSDILHMDIMFLNRIIETISHSISFNCLAKQLFLFFLS